MQPPPRLGTKFPRSDSMPIANGDADL